MSLIAFALVRHLDWPARRWVDFLLVLGIGLWCL
jgi:hypothetical protein